MFIVIVFVPFSLNIYGAFCSLFAIIALSVGKFIVTYTSWFVRVFTSTLYEIVTLFESSSAAFLMSLSIIRLIISQVFSILCLFK